MKKSKQKIIDFAKELYLQYDADGNKKYSNQETANLVAKNMRIKCGESTIRLWAKKFDWNKLIEKIKQQSIVKAKDEKFTTEEKIIESKSDDLGETYKHATQLENIGFDTAFKIYKGKNESEITFKDALQALKHATDIKFRINDIPDTDKGNDLKVLVSLDEAKEINKSLNDTF